MKRLTKNGILKRLIGYPIFLLTLLAALWIVSIQMPGTSFAGALPPLDAETHESSARLRAHVEMLAGQIGERNFIKLRALDSAGDYLHATLASYGYPVTEQTFTANGQRFRNIEATLRGSTRPNEIIIVGGHYDTVDESPGADDNASGTAGVLELARIFRDLHPSRTIRFVGFTNEEPPFFFTDNMGSRRYARAARARGDSIVAMLSLETIGYYRDAPKSQRYPPILGLFYPDRGNFIGVVGNIGSRALVRDIVREYRVAAQFPSAGSAAPKQIPGISWSDQWSFWQDGYVGVMITDTAPFRNPNYHEPFDRPDSLQYDNMARVVSGIGKVVLHLANTQRGPRS